MYVYIIEHGKDTNGTLTRSSMGKQYGFDQQFECIQHWHRRYKRKSIGKTEWRLCKKQMMILYHLIEGEAPNVGGTRIAASHIRRLWNVKESVVRGYQIRWNQWHNYHNIIHISYIYSTIVRPYLRRGGENWLSSGAIKNGFEKNWEKWVIPRRRMPLEPAMESWSHAVSL